VPDTTLADPARKRKSVVAAVLASMVFPGLGHLYLGRRRSAAVYAIPVLVLFAIVLMRVLSDGLDVLGIEMFAPSTSLTVLGIILAVGLWWLIALLDAFTTAGGRRPMRVVATALTGVLAVLIVGVTAYGAFNAWSVYQAGSQIFVNGGSDSRAASATPATSGDGASGAPTPLGSDPGIVDATPLTTPAPGSSRITVLLTGVDSSPTRNHSLNDTMIVVSLDTSTGKLAMVSFARDIAGFKMWDGSTYAGKLNSLMSAAQSDPKDYPLGGVNTLVKELSFLLGIPIDYYAAVNLPGFVALVDAAGGVTVTNDAVIADPQYGGWTSPSHPIGFHLGVGTFTLGGEDALAFARSRYGPGGNDFVRARRQQALILSLEKKLTSPSMLSRLPSIIKALGNTVRTNYPADQLSQVLTAAKAVNPDNTTRVVLGPPYAVRSTDPTTYSLTLDMARLKALSISLFGADSAYAPPPTPAAPASPSPSAAP
jgi:polyisoprenyl-teichoic acid--peptidoglycan teichoic acid transferase